MSAVEAEELPMPSLSDATTDESASLIGHVGAAAANTITGTTAPPPTQKRAALLVWRLAQGVLLLLTVAVIWVGAGELVQYIYSSDLRLPFLITYINNSEFIVLLPLRYLRERYACRVGERILVKRADGSSWRAAARAGLIVCPLWFLAQGSYNWSLAGTSVSSSTVLSTTSCVFTFALSLLVLKERFSWFKLLGVAITLAGAALVAYADTSDSSKNTWWGDALALFSALCYGCYTTAIRLLVPDDGAVSISLFFGFVGAGNFVLLSPIVGILHATGLERLSSIPAAFIGIILAKGLLDNVLSDLLWARAIQLTSATVATVALSLTIPLAMLSDLLIHGLVPAPLLAVGATLVAAGFVTSTLSLDGAACSIKAAAAPHAADARAADSTASTQELSLVLPHSAGTPMMK